MPEVTLGYEKLNQSWIPAFWVGSLPPCSLTTHWGRRQESEPGLGQQA
jgi:hypothetical protein